MAWADTDVGVLSTKQAVTRTAAPRRGGCLQQRCFVIRHCQNGHTGWFVRNVRKPIVMVADRHKRRALG